MATTEAKPTVELETEAASRLVDPFEVNYLGVLRTNDPLLLDKGQNIELYRDLKRDPKVHSCLQKLIGAIVGRPWAVEPVNEKDAADGEKLTDLLQMISFDQLCRDLLDAILMGYSVVEIIWCEKDGWIVPERLVKRRQRRFVYRQEDKDKAPRLKLLTAEAMVVGIDLPDRKFIVHRVNPEDDNPYGTGLGLQLYWLVFFKRKGIVSWVKLCDRFGSPTPWGRYPRNAGPIEKATLADALRAFSTDGYVMTPEGAQLELLESKLSGNITTQEQLVAEMNDAIAEVTIGQEPRANSGGAVASASKERSAVRLDIAQAHSDLLSETLNCSLIAWMCEVNGLARCVVYRQIKEEEDKKAESEMDKNVSEMGFELSEEAARTKYGEGWSKKKEASTPPLTDPVQKPVVDNKNLAAPAPEDKATMDFAEASDGADGQRAIDAAIKSLDQAKLQSVMESLAEPLLQAIDHANSFEEALAAIELAFPKVDPEQLQALLANAMFGAEEYGRVAE